MWFICFLFHAPTTTVTVVDRVKNHGKEPNQLGQLILNFVYFLSFSFAFSLPLSLTSGAYKINEQISAFSIPMIVHFSYIHTYLFLFYLPLSSNSFSYNLAPYNFGRLSLIWKYSIYNGIMIHFNLHRQRMRTASTAANVFLSLRLFIFLFAHVPYHAIPFIHILWWSFLNLKTQLRPRSRARATAYRVKYILWFWTALSNSYGPSVRSFICSIFFMNDCYYCCCYYCYLGEPKMFARSSGYTLYTYLVCYIEVENLYMARRCHRQQWKIPNDICMHACTFWAHNIFFIHSEATK